MNHLFGFLKIWLVFMVLFFCSIRAINNHEGEYMRKQRSAPSLKKPSSRKEDIQSSATTERSQKSASPGLKQFRTSMAQPLQGINAEEHFQMYLQGKQLLAERLWPSLDSELEIDTVSALLSWIRVTTHGSIPTVRQTSLDDFQKHLLTWKLYAPDALHMLKPLRKKHPHNEKVLLLYLEASLYDTLATWVDKGKNPTSLSAIKAALRLRRALRAADASAAAAARPGGARAAAAAQATLALGRLPAAGGGHRGRAAALRAAAAALEADPDGPRGRYLYGLALLRWGQWADTRAVFRGALRAPQVRVASATEADLAPFLTAQMELGIDVCNEMLSSDKNTKFQQ